jgi:hypothetical protein
MQTAKIKEILRGHFPRLIQGERVWILDRFKEVPSRQALEDVLKQTKVEMMNRGDCDNKSLQLHAAVEWLYPDWSFGEIVGLIDVLASGVHGINYCLTEEGLYLVEPSTDEILEPTRDNLDAFFVRG